MRHHSKIDINPETMCGKPVIKGTRITVEHILRNLSEGVTPVEIAANYPTIKVEDVYLAQAYAADLR